MSLPAALSSEGPNPHLQVEPDCATAPEAVCLQETRSRFGVGIACLTIIGVSVWAVMTPFPQSNSQPVSVTPSRYAAHHVLAVADGDMMFSPPMVVPLRQNAATDTQIKAPSSFLPRASRTSIATNAEPPPQATSDIHGDLAPDGWGRSAKLQSMRERARRDMLLQAMMTGLTIGSQPQPAAAAAAKEDDDEDEDKPASVPKQVTYAVKDEVCEKHPTWKQCKKKLGAGGGGLNPNAPEITLTSGLKVKELVTGKGNTPRVGDKCTVHYSLYYKGNEIESSRESSGLAASPIGFEYGTKEGYGSAIPAISLGIEDMKVGGVRRITAPPDMAFGKKGRQGGRVPPDATVEFDVQLLSVKRSGTNPISSQGRGSEVNSDGLFNLR